MISHSQLAPYEARCKRCGCTIHRMPDTPNCRACTEYLKSNDKKTLTEEADDMYWGWPPSHSLSLTESGEESPLVQPEGEGGVDG